MQNSLEIRFRYLYSALILIAGCGKNEETILEGGVVVTDIRTGEGIEATHLDRVTVHYEGYLEDGTLFDRSTKPGREPLRFTIGAEEVIQGLEKGVIGLRIGGKRKIRVPAELGYGIQGVEGRIPPNADLVFEIEMVRIERFD